LFGIGRVVFEDWLPGLLLLAIAAAAGYSIFWNLSRKGWESLSGRNVSSGDAHAAETLVN